MNTHFRLTSINRTTKGKQKLCGLSASYDSMVASSTNNIVLIISTDLEHRKKLKTKQSKSRFCSRIYFIIIINKLNINFEFLLEK